MSASTLIVDDNPHVRSILRSFVEENTTLKVCGEAADGLEAIERTKELTPDVILLDIAMPRMTGVEAAPILRRIVPNAHIIMVTMFADSLSATVPSSIGVDTVHCKMDGIARLGDVLKPIAAAHACDQSDPEQELKPLCLQVAGEQDGNRLRQVIDELHREELPKE